MVQGKIRVLHVDDEKPLLDLTKIYLERTGDFTVETAQSAAEALKKLSASSIDAIVSDYQMPGMDGIAFLKAFRSSGNTIPFIIFTGRAARRW
jgi:CheY-like chemotaxis protein